MINLKPYLLAFRVLLAISAINSVNAVWQPAEVISDPGEPVSGLNGPVLSVNPQGNAIAVWTNRSSPTFPSQRAIASSFYTRGVGWSPPQLISSLAFNPFGGPLYTAQGDPDVRMNASNYAVAAWEGEFSDITFPAVIFGTVRQSNGTFGPVQVISEFNSDLLAKNPNVAVNDAGTSVVIYRSSNEIIDPPETVILVTTLPFGGAWSTPVQISSIQTANGEQDNKPDIDINAAGDLVAVWDRRFPDNIFGIDAATYNAASATWSSPVTLDIGTSAIFDGNPKCSIDENGNAVAIWLVGSTVKTSSFTPGIGWSQNVILATDDASGPTIIMDPVGNATAIWEQNREIYSASKPLSGVWSTPEVISTGTTNSVLPFQSQEPLAVDLSGNVIAIWQSSQTSLSSAFRLLNQPWEAPESVFSSEDQLFYPSVGLASCGFAVALWGNAPDDTVMAAINANLFKPSDTGFTRCKQKFASQSVFLNILNWSTQNAGCILQYNIYCNGDIIGTVPGNGPNRFVFSKDCRNRCNFTITSVNIFGFESDPVPFSM